MNDLTELKEQIVVQLDVLEFLDILGLELPDIIDKFDEEIEESKSQLISALR